MTLTFSAWRVGIQRALRGYRHFVPAVIINWLVVGVAATQVPDAAPLAQGGLFIVGAPFYAAGAVRACGLTERNPFWFAIERSSTVIDMLMVVVFVGGVLIVCLVLGFVYNGEQGAVVALALGGVFCLVPLARFWPVFCLAYFFEGTIRWTPAGQGSIWSGPGLGMAWRMTGTPGTFWKISIPLLLVTALLVGSGGGLYLFKRSFITALFFWGAILPLASTLTVSTYQVLARKAAG